MAICDSDKPETGISRDYRRRQGRGKDAGGGVVRMTEGSFISASFFGARELRKAEMVGKYA